MLSKRSWLIIKLCLSALLIGYLLQRIPLRDILHSLAQVDGLWLGVAVLLAIVGKIISTLRWRYLLAVQEMPVPFGVLFCSLLVGYFFNNFLPSTIGGDAVRAFDVARYSRRNMASVVTVLTERVMGILALASLALVAALLGFELIRPVGQVWLIVVVFFMVSFGGYFLITRRSLVERGVRLLHRLKWKKPAQKVEEAFRAFSVMRDRRGVLNNVFMISVLLQLNVLLYYYVLSLSLHLGVSIFYFFCMIPVILVTLQLPVSINGIGVREGLYVFFLGLVGVGGEKAIAFSWLDFSMTIVMGLAGGVVFALRRTRRNGETARIS